ncbi:DUF7546 family protein [Natronomonas sp. EA1]|uniref:DUF7546 family protein n=1 Tax=Natronomonas sp. EA1 TaxID=3421655 RepID=UPI003EBA58E0
MATTSSVRRRLATLDSRAVALFLGLELLGVAGYYLLGPADIEQPRYALYPWIWINLGLLAVWRTDPLPASGRARLLAGALAGGYVLLLAWLAGLVALDGHSHGLSGFVVTMSAPGWGPRVSYVAGGFHVSVIPYLTVGYLALGYLLYAAVLRARALSLAGLLGVGSCLSCAFPVILGGVGAALSPAVASVAIDLSTAAFVVTVGLLWRAT